MAQICETVSERAGNQAFMPQSSISYKHAHLDSNFSAEMALTGSSLASPSRSRALTTSAAQQDQMSSTQFPSVDLRSGEPSQNQYSLHPSYEYSATGKSQRSMSEPRYVENYLNISHTNRNTENTDQQRESTSSPLSHLGHPLTPLSEPSPGMSEDGELKITPAPSSQCSSLQAGSEDHQTRPPEIFDAIKEVDSMPKTDSSTSRNDRQALSSDEDDGMDDDESESESEQDASEEREVIIDEEVEASVLRATGNNFGLAARLISQLYELYQPEESPISRAWQPCFHKCAGNSSGYTKGTSGLDVNSFGGSTGQNTNDRKRRREDDEENSEEGNINRDRNGGGDRENITGDGGGDSDSHPLACPFNKRYPKTYNRLSRFPGRRKGDYTSCESGFDTDQRFKEHLERKHLHVQCELCSKVFSTPPKQRAVEFQRHRSNPQECGTRPPDIHEGMTELQWAEISALPRQSRSTTTNGKPRLTVRKWNLVWNILFPNDRDSPPPAWCTATIVEVDQLPSSLEEEKEDFRRVYNFIANNADENLSHEYKALQAFELWSTNRKVKYDALRLPQQRMSQMTLQEPAVTQIGDSRMGQNQLNESGPTFLKETTSQQRVVRPRVSSHPQPLQHSSNEQEFFGTLPSTGRSASDPTLWQQSSGQLPGYSQPISGYGKPAFTTSQGQQKGCELGYASAGTMHWGNGPSPTPNSNSQNENLRYQSAAQVGYDIFDNLENYAADHSQYNNNSTDSHTSGVFPIQQMNHTPQPFTQPSQYEHHTYNANPTIKYPVYPQEGYAPASNTMFGQPSATTNQPRQLRQEILPYAKPHPNRSFSQYMPEPSHSNLNVAPDT